MEPSEFYEYEDRAYIQPTLSSGEQEAFIDNLRNIQSQNNAQIAQQTYNLGTQVPSNLGGLGGGEAYFTSRYQTPQMLEQVDTLKSAAQAQALQDVMSNYQAQLKQQYQSAYRNYNKRQRARARAAAAAAANGNNPIPESQGGIEYEDPVITPDNPPTITTVPIDGHNTTAYTIGSDYVVYDETTGEYYVNGKNVGNNPSHRSMSDQRNVAGQHKGTSLGGGSSW